MYVAQAEYMLISRMLWVGYGAIKKGLQFLCRPQAMTHYVIGGGSLLDYDLVCR